MAKDTFTFHILSKKLPGESDSVGVNKSHISCYRMDTDTLTIFFNGNEEPIVFQSIDKAQPNFVCDDEMMGWFGDWFDNEWLDTLNLDVSYD